MFRQGLRATIVATDTDVPIGVFTAGQVMTYDAASNTFKGTTPTAAGPSVPGTTVVGDLVTWNSTTGAAIADSSILASDLVVDVAGGKTVGNIAVFANAAGTSLADGGVNVAALNKFTNVMLVTSSFSTFPVGTLTSIPGLAASLPRAGTYYFDVTLGVSMATITTPTVGFGFSVSLLTGSLFSVVHHTNTAAFTAQVANGVGTGGLPYATLAHATTNVLPTRITGTITVSGGATFQLKAQNSTTANTATVVAGSGGLVREL